MNRDELAKVIYDAVKADAALTGYDEYCSGYVALIAADAAIAALAPKLTWTGRDDGVSSLMLGTIKVADIYRGLDRTGSFSGGHDTPENIATLRADIERRVREAMEGKP